MIDSILLDDFKKDLKGSLIDLAGELPWRDDEKY